MKAFLSNCLHYMRDFHADSESGLLSYDSMIASLRIAKNPDVRPKKNSWSTPFSIQFFSPGDARGPAPSDCGGTAAARRFPDPRGT